MATALAAKRIKDSLQKARDVGLIEDDFTLCGCSVVMRNLRPDEYSSITTEAAEFEDVQFLYEYQIGHVSRAIVEINGVNLRGVDFIEDEEPDPKDPQQTKVVKFERHAWVRKALLDSWSREAISTAYRKFAEILVKADEASKAGVTFILPDETPEDKFRRLLAEFKEIEGDIPPELAQHILADNGYLHRVTSKEMESIDTRLAGAAQTDQSSQEAPEPAPAPLEPVKAESAPASANPEPEAPRIDPRELMRRRTPLNQVEASSPTREATTQAPVPRRGPPAVDASTRPRTNQIAEIEAGLEALTQGRPLPPGMVPPTPPDSMDLGQPPKPAVAEISKPLDRVDPREVHKILDQPPTGGLNPRYRPPTRP